MYSVLVDASSYNFLFYEGGVFSDVNCGSDETNLSHAMLLVGYVAYEESEQSYWILKNRYRAHKKIYNMFHQISKNIHQNSFTHSNNSHHIFAICCSFLSLVSSWGASWGADGYMMLVRGQNMCGVATQATYPVVISM